VARSQWIRSADSICFTARRLFGDGHRHIRGGASLLGHNPLGDWRARLAFVPLTVVDFFLDYPDELNTIAFTALPVGIGVSILRYRLWDVDVIIRKTLLYGLLTAVIVAVYFTLVLIGQSAFVTLTGQESPLAIVISTLAIATLFNPLRRRIQAFIDRRFFRSRYDAQLVLAEFVRLAGSEVEIDALTIELQSAIQQTLQPSAITIWLKEHDAR
jgi:hypothetical protein